MINKSLFSSNTSLWSTPQDFFDAVNDEFHFDIDVCALPENAKCNRYFTPEDDGLSQDWGCYTSVWCNPPYGKDSVKWISKAYTTSRLCGTTVVMLLPARTDTKAFHEYIYNKSEIRFIKGRLKFGGGVNSVPFPSMLVIFRGKNYHINKEKNGIL